MYDLVCIGGGPAGTSAAITAARHGAHVLLLERGSLPRHKVCGEFVSAESLSLLASLLSQSPEGRQVIGHAIRISQARLFIDHTMIKALVEPAAASIPRLMLDQLLWQAAVQLGVECRQRCDAEQIQSPTRPGEPFLITANGSRFESRAVIDATGRWSRFTGLEVPAGAGKWIGLKAHYSEPDAVPSVDLYFFDGGYCGVSPVSKDQVNACAMVRADAARSLAEVFLLHPLLAERSGRWNALTAPVSTSPLLFRDPVPLRQLILCAGDSAGFIDPFAGDGISLALRSGAAAADSLAHYFADQTTLAVAGHLYRQTYQRNFVPALRAAARIRRLIRIPTAVRRLLLPLLQAPGIADLLVRKTRAVG
jgi:flavin-dependent dehydrogenase